jgi:DNA-binding NarL/FixJ family response regulator
MIRVLIADTHTVLRHGLRLILQEDPDLSVVGEAANAAELMDQVEAAAPDVVLMDVNLSDQCGIQTVRQIRLTASRPQVLILTVSDQCDNMLPAFQAGAKGYLLKSVSGQEVIQAIHQVATGQAVLPPTLTTLLIDELATPSPTLGELTERELDVLQCITQGLGNKEIATNLNISHNTVKTHVRRILAKLNLRNRTEAATFAVQTNLLAGN